jgi:NhaP-type Na+/H+ or K+/H+ antiporter
VLVFGVVVVVTLIATVILGTVLGSRYSVAPPVLLIVFGALVGLIPRFGGIRLDGQIVLLLFLPAIHYWESLNISLREVRANLRTIVLRSVVLVIVTAATVSLTAQALHGAPVGAVNWRSARVTADVGFGAHAFDHVRVVQFEGGALGADAAARCRGSKRHSDV